VEVTEGRSNEGVAEVPVIWTGNEEPKDTGGGKSGNEEIDGVGCGTLINGADGSPNDVEIAGAKLDGGAT